jgi:hypothetical protein
MDFYSLSLRAARRDAMRAFRADIPGYIAGTTRRADPDVRRLYRNADRVTP